MREMPKSGGLVGRALSWLVTFLVLSAAYLYTLPQPNILYAGVVLLHALGGVLVAILLVPVFVRLMRTGSFSSKLGWLLIAAGAILGLILIKTGTPRTEWNKLYLHIVISLAGVGLLIAGWLGQRGPRESSLGAAVVRGAVCLAMLAGIGYGARYLRESWQTRGRIQNPTMPPDNMNGEGNGPEGSFFPSSAQVTVNRKFPASSSWSQIPASAATRTSTTSGSAPRTISRRSTISGTASRSSTCRIQSAPSLRSGAADATTQRCCMRD